MNADKMSRMKELVYQLKEASKAYYAEDREIMSNFEYDRLYDELEKLEAETGVTLADSPTVNVGYEAVEELPKERHASPMLSLGKTKSRDELKDWLQGKPAILSWKLDGLTVVLSYHAGKLAKAVTRGNGEVGEVITNNARTFKNIPLSIPYQGELVLRGEAVITYSDFEKINAEITNEEEKYKNPRNLCSGSVRQLNNEVTANRNVRFFAFSLVNAEGVDFDNSREKQFLFLKEQGFEVVESVMVTPDTISEAIEGFEKKIENYDIPSDGLVLTFEDIAYGQSLGRTAKFPRDAIAFKWADELKETTLKEIEWSPSRTGLINPVAIFEPVELEGTTVSRASVHNISILRGLKLGLGDRITVYKANMIIPQIADNLTGSDTVQIPENCPVCGGQTVVKSLNEAESLYCTNPDCAAKKIKAFTEGKITFGVAEVDDIMLVLLEIENLIESDMAFQINLYPVQYRMVADEFKDGTGYATFLALVDGMTGKVVALRAVGLGTKISNTIRGLIQGQMTTEAYDNRAFSFKLREYYRRNTVADTKKKCLVSYVCGTLEETSSK